MFKGITKKVLSDAKVVVAEDIDKHVPTILAVLGATLGLIGCGILSGKSKTKSISVVYNYYITYNQISKDV